MPSKPRRADHNDTSRQDRAPGRINYSPADLDRADRLKQVLEALKEINLKVPIVVEGKRDARALREMGIEGEIVTLHSGAGIYEFSERLMDEYDNIVLLMDWDQKGEQLLKALEEHLPGHYEEFSVFREVIKILCQKDIKDIEGIPGLLKRLEGMAGIAGLTGNERPGQQG